MRSVPLFRVALGLLAAGAPPGAQPASGVDFQREVRPILSENCFHCHGPDKATRMADLRLDTRDGIFSARPNGSVVAPGSAGTSLLFERISHEKDSMRMPPAVSKKKLTQQQKDLLRR